MLAPKHENLPLRADADIVAVRQTVRRWAIEIGLSLVEQTKVVTAASELARNAIEHGGGGEANLEILRSGARWGLKIAFKDQGPGIPDIALALTDKYTTGNGLGLGLGGAKRLVSEFHIASQVGSGTQVTITQWK